MCNSAIKLNLASIQGVGFHEEIIVTYVVIVSKCNCHFSLPVFRKQRCWAWSSSRTAGWGPSSWGFCCRASVRPQKSTWGQVQPHPGLNPSQLTPSLHPIISELFFLQLFFLNQGTPNPFVCTAGTQSDVQQTPVSSTSPSALFWYLFFENCFCTVFIVCLFWQKHFMYF